MRALLCLVLVACSAPGPRTPAPPRLGLEWSMTVDADRLRLDYTLRNDTPERVLVLDGMRTADARPPSAIVRAVDGGRTVAFTLGHVPPPPGEKRDLRPVARYLAPRASVRGTAYVPWPLRASSPSTELPSVIGGLVLEIGYVAGASTLETIALGGEQVTVPDTHTLGDQRLLRSAVRDLPPPQALPEAEHGPLEVTWAPVREGARLRLDYTVTNTSEQSIVLCDGLRGTNGPTELAIVRPTESAGVVAFTLAFVRPLRTIVEKQPRPVARTLAPHESATGTAYVELPLGPQHPFYIPEYTLPPRFDYAVLEVGFVDGTRPLDVETSRGQRFEVASWPALQAQTIARSNVQRLP